MTNNRRNPLFTGRELLVELQHAWTVMTGQPAGDLGKDLEVLGEVFGPSASEERISKRIRSLGTSEIGRGTSQLYPSLLFPAGEGVLVTVEGRVAIDLLEENPNLTPEEAARAAASSLTTIETYREWSMVRVIRVNEREGGSGERIYPAAIATTLLLLLHRATDRTPLELPPPDSEGDKLWMAPVKAFNAKLSTRKGGNLKTSFRDYPVKKAERRLGPDLFVKRPRGAPWSVYVPADRVDAVTAIVAEEMARRRNPLKEELDAIDALTSRYQEILPRLEKLGMGCPGGPNRATVERVKELLLKERGHQANPGRGS